MKRNPAEVTLFKSSAHKWLVRPGLNLMPDGQQMRARSGTTGILRMMPMLPNGPTPRRYVQAVRSCLCHRCGRQLVGRTSKLLRTIYRAHLRRCPRTPLA